MFDVLAGQYRGPSGKCAVRLTISGLRWWMTAWALLLMSNLTTPLAYAIDVIYVPDGYPRSAQALPIDAGHIANEDLYCAEGFVGLELARQALGLAVCDSDAVSREVLTGGNLTGIDAVILVDDTGGLDPTLERLLSGAVWTSGNYRGLQPYGFRLQGQRNLVTGGTLPPGYRVLVVGEQFYRDYFQGQPAADVRWRRHIDGVYRSMSRPSIQVQPAQLQSTQGRRQIFQTGMNEYDQGHYEVAYEYFLVLNRVAGLPNQVYADIQYNMTRSLWSAASKYFEDGAYQRALEVFERLSTDATLLDLGTSDLHWNIAVCLLRLDEQEGTTSRHAEAMQRFRDYTKAVWEEASPQINTNGPLSPGLRQSSP